MKSLSHAQEAQPSRVFGGWRVRLMSGVAWLGLAVAIGLTFGSHHYPGWWLEYGDVKFDSARERVAPIAQWLTEVRPTARVALVVLAICGLGLLQQAHALGGRSARLAARAVQLLVLLGVSATFVPSGGLLAVGALAALPLCFVHWPPDAWAVWLVAALVAGTVFSLAPATTRSQSLLRLNIFCLFVAAHAYGVLALTPQAQSWN